MLKVLGTGQPRTGTNSLQHALEKLGFGPCYHFFTLLQERPGDVKEFAAARDEKQPDWQTLFADFGSAVDFPAALYYESILKTYPDAKVVLSVRDTEAWYKSISETVFKASQPPLMKKVRTALRALTSPHVRERLPVLAYAGRMIRDTYGPDLSDKAAVIAAHENLNAEVLARLPKERVLVFDVKEGWEPLCAFLGVPVPNEPFPRINSTEEFKAVASKL